MNFMQIRVEEHCLSLLSFEGPRVLLCYSSHALLRGLTLRQDLALNRRLDWSKHELLQLPLPFSNQSSFASPSQFHLHYAFEDAENL